MTENSRRVTLIIINILNDTIEYKRYLLIFANNCHINDIKSHNKSIFLSFLCTCS